MQQFLTTFDRERRDDDVAAAGQSLPQFLTHRVTTGREGVIDPIAVAVGRFADDVVVAARPVRLRVERLFFRSEVTREKHADGFTAVGKFDLGG